MRHLLSAIIGMLLLIFGDPAHAQQAATLVTAHPIADAPAGTQACRVRYMSASDKGRPEDMTAVVIAPAGRPTRMGRPVLAWARGTWGISDKCTPSASAQLVAAFRGFVASIVD